MILSSRAIQVEKDYEVFLFLMPADIDIQARYEKVGG